MRESPVSLHTMRRIFLRTRKTPGHKDAGQKAKSELLSPSEVDKESVWHSPGKCAETWAVEYAKSTWCLFSGSLKCLQIVLTEQQEAKRSESPKVLGGSPGPIPGLP
jgi:hypothetical protein